METDLILPLSVGWLVGICHKLLTKKQMLDKVPRLYSMLEWKNETAVSVDVYIISTQFGLDFLDEKVVIIRSTEKL